jgi:serine/threonine protein kinase
VEREIADVVEELRRTDSSDQSKVDYLRKEKEQLRKEKEQLRKEKEQLYDKHEEDTYRSQLEMLKLSTAKDTGPLPLEALLAKKGIIAESSIIRLIGKRFSFQGSFAVMQQNSEMAADVYESARLLPNTETCKEISVGGLAINGSLFIGNDTLQIAFEETKPRVLKTLRADEFRRAEQVAHAFGSNLLLCDSDNVCDNITKFRLISSREKHFMLMPLFPATLEHLPHLGEETAEKMIMQVSTSLKALHQRNLSHMDIKPSNICISNAGDFVVADLGSVERFGSTSQSTEAYIPSDLLLKGRAASPDMDWWMLSVTLCEKMFHIPVGSGASSFSRSWVLDTLSSSEAARRTGLVATLTELSE